MPNQRRYAWKASEDHKRYKIYYILLRIRYRNHLTIQSYLPRPENRYRPCQTSIKNEKQSYDVEYEKTEKRSVQTRICVQDCTILSESSNIQWENVKDSITTAADEVLEPRKQWMIDGILSLIQERNKYIGFKSIHGQEKYKKLKYHLTQECREAKEECLSNEQNVRQSCSLSPYLFNLFIEDATKLFKLKTQE